VIVMIGDSDPVKEPTTEAVSTGSGQIPAWVVVSVIGAVAVFTRVCNVGSFSLWRDEIFTMRVSSLPLLETLAACAADADNVPLYAVIANLCLRIGLDDPWIRLVPIAAGLASIGLLAVWVERHFGRTAALLTAAFSALSPFHIRFSQELRAYPYLLLICTATMLIVDRLRLRPDWRSTFALSVIVAVGLYTNLTYVLVLVPAAGIAVVVPQSRHDPNRVRATNVRLRFAAAVGLGLIAFMPWLLWIWSPLRAKVSRYSADGWTLGDVADRWLSLTIAPGFEGTVWFGVVLAGVFGVGLVVASTTRTGRAVLSSAVATLVAFEACLVHIDRWTRPRYDTAVWPFIAVLIALGLEQVSRWLRWRWLQWGALAAVAAVLLLNIDMYHRHGRRHWDLLADAVREVRRTDERLVTADYFAERGLSYYLDEEVPTVNRKLFRLRQHLAESPTILLASRYSVQPEDLRSSWVFREIARVHSTGWLYRLHRADAVSPPDSVGCTEGRPGRWPDPIAERVSGRLVRPPGGCLPRLVGGPHRRRQARLVRLDFTTGDRGLSQAGWGDIVVRDDGTTLAWVMGREASAEFGAVESSPGRLEIRLWPSRELADDMWMRALINGRVVGVRPLKPRPRVIGIDVPADVWHHDRNILVLQFMQACSDQSFEHGRSVAVDWIQWESTEPPLKTNPI
jgi:hypothetical protein